MIIHRAIQAIYDENQRLNVVSIIKLNDHNNVTNPALNHESLIEISTQILPLFQPTPGAMLDQMVNLNTPIGLRAERSHFRMITDRMAAFDAFRNAANTIRSILAFTVNINTNTHGPVQINEIEYNIICDIIG